MDGFNSSRFLSKSRGFPQKGFIKEKAVLMNKEHRSPGLGFSAVQEVGPYVLLAPPGSGSGGEAGVCLDEV